MSTSANSTLVLEQLPGIFAVCRLPHDHPLPPWLALEDASDFVCVSRTDRELSIVIDETRLPAATDAKMKVQRSFAAFRIAGTLDFSEIGILAKLAAALAQANVPVFVVSTYETDVILINQADAHRAVEALRTIADVRM